MLIEKRHIILAALVVALGAAVYINWQFTDNQALQSTGALDNEQLGQAQYVNGSVSSYTPTATESAVTSSLSQSANSAYFTEARMNRQKARDEAVELLNKVVEDTSATEEAKKEAANTAAQIAKNIEAEAKIESLIKAKNFADCVAFIDNGKANIVVSSPQGLLESDTLTINEIVKGQTDIPFKDITIVEVK